MNRKDFGLWGLELTPAEFARALAALGVFQGSIERWPYSLSVETIWKALSKVAVKSKGILHWRLDVVDPAELDKLKPANTATLFEKAWTKFAKARRATIRFELHLERFGDYFWIADKLLSPAVKQLSPADARLQPKIARTALYVRVDKPQAVVGWNWPLRLGFLKDHESQQLRQQLEQAFKTSTLTRLVEIVDVANESDDCGLLLFPQDVRGVLSELLKMEWRPRADCVLVLGGDGKLSGRLTALLQAVRAEVRTSGVGLLSVPEEQRGDWIQGLIAGLAHNNSLDVALFLAELEAPAPSPLLVASRGLIELTLVSRTASRFRQALKRRVIESPIPRSVRLRRSKRVGIKYRGGQGSGYGRRLAIKADAAGVARELARVKDWLKETGGATTVARHSRAAETLIKKFPLTSESRRIQAQVFESPGYKQRRSALRPDTSYAVDVRISPLTAKWESAEKEFPVEKLPPSEKGHDLTVVFTEPRVSPEPQVGKLFLPPQGATPHCRFYFRTSQSLDPVKARVTVLHQNRVIQTAILEAPVTISKQTRNLRIKVSIEARVLPHINDLGSRQTFDAAVVLNHASDGNAYATAMAGDDAVMFSLDETSLNQTILTLNDELTNLADDPDSYPKDLAAPATTKLLNTLAIHGKQLYNNLFTYRPGNAWLAAKDKKKIQIISTRLESDLPLEFLYDYKAPNLNAKLCPYAKKSLAKGQCDKACGGPKNKQNVVCPLGFWGLNRVIERHAFDGTRNLQGNTYALMASPSTQRQPLQVLQSALFAASEEVDKARKGTISRLEKLLKEKTKQTNYVSNWKGWVAKVKSSSPSLLLLLSHTEPDPELNNMPALEIAELPRLRVVDISEEYVRKPRTNTRPLVMLVGCKTNAPDNRLHKFVPAFGTYAAIVLSTGATVLALQAAQVASELLRALSRLPKNKDVTFGDVMLDLRRKLLAKGLPMVLCLSAYGDADWKLK